MKAIVYTRYGPPDVLQLKDVAKPEPRKHQVPVRVHAASANALDYRRFEGVSLERAAEAHRYVERGHKRGHVVITVA
jgi:hypothetical protein